MKQLALLFFALLSFGSITAQNQETLFTIENVPVTVDEFKAIYMKNAANAVSKESFEDYFELFVNFKLKVLEAKQMKIDTSRAFSEEYEGYVKQLAQPYLTDVEVNQKLIDEAYDRMTKEVNASHILINIPNGDDTLKYYQKAIEVRNRIINGEPFEKVAAETSNDASVSRNKGALGYFTAFQMVYPFESAAFSTPIGEISQPVRSQFGYHIIKVNDIRPSQGQVKIAHIMIKTPSRNDPMLFEAARKKIVDIHTRLLNGEDFAKLAKDESQDAGTASQGGEFAPWISSGRIIPEIERVAFALPSKGSISKPFQSQYGWHVLKLIDRKIVGSKEEMLPEIRTMIARDTRSFKSKDSFIAKLKAEYGFKQDLSKLSLVKVDSSVYVGKWTIPAIVDNATVFTLNGEDFKVLSFAKFLKANQRFARNISLSEFVSKAYEEWVQTEIIAYEATRLSLKYPDFKQLQQEYFDGMMLFEVTDRVIWSKSTDSLAISTYYASHSDRYRWNKRVHYSVYTLSDVKMLDKFKKILLSKKNANLSSADIAAIASKKLKTAIGHEQKTANINSPNILGYEQWSDGLKTEPFENGLKLTKISKITTGDVKSLDDCKGEITVDMQVEMESQWIAQLKKKYSVVVNEVAYKKLSNELK